MNYVIRFSCNHLRERGQDVIILIFQRKKKVSVVKWFSESSWVIGDKTGLGLQSSDLKWPSFCLTTLASVCGDLLGCHMQKKLYINKVDLKCGR